MHHDPLRSTQKPPFFAFGHNFVVFSLQVALPFAPQNTGPSPSWSACTASARPTSALPEKEESWSANKPAKLRPGSIALGPKLAMEMIQLVASWIPERRLRVLGDSEYAGQSISRHLPANVKLISRMNMKAALYEPAEKVAKRGRRRKKGNRLPSPLQMAQNQKAKWIKTTIALYGKKVELWYQTIDALWYPSAGQQLLRIVVVRDPSGRRRDDCFFSLDLTLSATQILEIFSRRCPLEVCFRDVKQFLGFEDPQNRVAKATTRTAPLVFYIYDLVLLWHAQAGYRLAAKSALDRLWYPQKDSVSFEDVLRTLRHATWAKAVA